MTENGRKAKVAYEEIPICSKLKLTLEFLGGSVEDYIYCATDNDCLPHFPENVDAMTTRAE